MVSMEAYKQLSARGIDVDRREYSDTVQLVADFGPTESVSVDVVGDTVIVVTDDETFDVELEGNVQAFIRNGVLTIELTAEGDE